MTIDRRDLLGGAVGAMAAVMTGVCYGERTDAVEPFWEWPGWPDWFGKQLQAMAAEPVR